MLTGMMYVVVDDSNQVQAEHDGGAWEQLVAWNFWLQAGFGSDKKLEALISGSSGLGLYLFSLLKGIFILRSLHVLQTHCIIVN